MDERSLDLDRSLHPSAPLAVADEGGSRWKRLVEVVGQQGHAPGIWQPVEAAGDGVSNPGAIADPLHELGPRGTWRHAAP
jgi:hypothetical protein